MTTRRTPLKEDITEEILNLTAGEKEWTLPSYQGEMIKKGKSETKTGVSVLQGQVRELQGKAKELEEAVEEDLVRWSKDKLIVKPAELTTEEYAIQCRIIRKKHRVI
jgi:hypothetical protein